MDQAHGEQERNAMVHLQIERRGVRDPLTLRAMASVPRHLFVPPDRRHLAYADGALPIGAGQTISQPYIVALMTEALGLHADSRVLEIGTGSGYQTAVLAEVVREGVVYTIERHADLSYEARRVLERVGYDNVHFRVGDGTLGWPEAAPFDAILVTAAGPFVPETLREQLHPAGGRLVIPVGPREEQELFRYTRHGDRWEQDSLGRVQFVPLIGEEGWDGEGSGGRR